MKHTPGPWKLIVDDKAYFGDELKIVTDNRHIATVNPATNEGPANAQLIASAPDLLEELTRLKELNREMVEAFHRIIELSWYGETCWSDGYIRESCTKAIAKAEEVQGE